MNSYTSNNYEEGVAILEKHGAHSDLFICLSGAGNSGKSRAVHASRRFCNKFCQQSDIPFEEKSIYHAAASESAAALLGGSTLNEAVGLNRYQTHKIKERQV